MQHLLKIDNMAKGSRKAQSFVSAKIRKIAKEGIRGKKVSREQRIAIALSMARKRGLKVGRVPSVPKTKRIKKVR